MYKLLITLTIYLLDKYFFLFLIYKQLMKLIIYFLKICHLSGNIKI